MKKYLITSVILFLLAQCLCFSQEILAVDALNKTISIPVSKDSIVVLIFCEKPCCHLCMERLGKRLAELKKDSVPLNSYNIIKSQNIVLVRKTDRIYFKQFIKADSTFFDFPDSTNSDSLEKYSLFRKYQVTSTPSVLIVYQNQREFIPLSLLQQTNYSIVEEKIKEILKVKD